MATELKTRKYTKEQMISYLEKHGSSQNEAANIAGTSPRTLNRYLSQGIIPSEWLSKIQSALKDRKPVPKVSVKPEPAYCASCGKKIADNKDKGFHTDSYGLKKLGVTTPPAKGWHWFTPVRGGKKKKVYSVCEKCFTSSFLMRLKSVQTPSKPKSPRKTNGYLKEEIL